MCYFYWRKKSVLACYLLHRINTGIGKVKSSKIGYNWYQVKLVWGLALKPTRMVCWTSHLSFIVVIDSTTNYVLKLTVSDNKTQINVPTACLTYRSFKISWTTYTVATITCHETVRSTNHGPGRVDLPLKMGNHSITPGSIGVCPIYNNNRIIGNNYC